ncbi:unnamed protein product [Leptosia nina]|uniref:Peptidase S1 domain-containing protein n=1 Tax=Leptosia nina TaxID=320188 RepID=A0AAV1JN77_9NEOP
MKTLFVLSITLSCAFAKSLPHPFLNYHEEVGIPFANRLKQIELASDFDGSRIVGGEFAPLGAYPHMAGLVIPMPTGHTSACGGSLISNTRALTAAHCWIRATRMTVVLGSTTLFYGGVRVDTSTVILHGGWDMTKGLENDIAVIVMPWVGFNSFIQPINLYTATNDLTGSWVTAAGYGRTGDSAVLQPDQSLKHFTTQVISNDECRARLGTMVVHSNICIRSGSNNDNVCNSDSGGPLTIGVGRNAFLIGVLSFGSGRCERGDPAAFARVSYYAPWIRAHM